MIPGELAHLYKIQEVFVPFKHEDVAMRDEGEVRVKIEVDEEFECREILARMPLSPGRGAARPMKIEGRDEI